MKTFETYIWLQFRRCTVISSAVKRWWKQIMDLRSFGTNNKDFYPQPNNSRLLWKPFAAAPKYGVFGVQQRCSAECWAQCGRTNRSWTPQLPASTGLCCNQTTDCPSQGSAAVWTPTGSRWGSTRRFVARATSTRTPSRCVPPISPETERPSLSLVQSRQKCDDALIVQFSVCRLGPARPRAGFSGTLQPRPPPPPPRTGCPPPTTTRTRATASRTSTASIATLERNNCRRRKSQYLCENVTR